MEFLTWLLAFVMGGAIAIGIAFLICSLILNASNNKGDSRSKIEDYSSDILFFCEQNRLHNNRTEFVHLLESNIETMVASNEYAFHYERSLPFASKEPVSRYIPGEDEAAGEAGASGMAGAPIDPIIFSCDLLSIATVRSALSGMHAGIRIGQGTEAGKFGTFHTLSGIDMTAIAHNSLSGSGTLPVRSAGVPASRPSAPVESPWATARRQNMGTAATSTTPAAGAVSASSSGAPAATGASPAASEPGQIYEAPTATRPLWENTNNNDDFSDFNDLM